jgi:hypothetical protein
VRGVGSEALKGQALAWRPCAIRFHGEMLDGLLAVAKLERAGGQPTPAREA